MVLSLICAAPQGLYPEESSLETTVAQDYQSLLTKVERTRIQLAKDYQQADLEEKEKIIERSRNYVFNVLIQELFPAWYGTPWDFNGFTDTPNESSIACGFFVTTTLRDVGFNLNRRKHGVEPSEKIIQNLTDEDNMRRYSNKGVEHIIEEIKDMGHGLYIVGLDSHVGFIANDADKLRFIHSSYYDPPFAVVSEELDSFNPLKHSRYRVIGKILTGEMMEKWLLGLPFEVKYSYFK